MKLVWSGAGFVIPVFSALGFIGLVLVDVRQRGAFWVWGALALVLAAVILPLGLVLNSKRRTKIRGGSTHHFMFIPMQYWGGVLLLAGLGLFVAEAVAGTRARPARATSPCVELAEVLKACRSLGPAKVEMLQQACEASALSAQIRCADCIQASADACSPSACSSVCRFAPAARR